VSPSHIVLDHELMSSYSPIVWTVTVYIGSTLTISPGVLNSDLRKLAVNMGKLDGPYSPT
jgi:hypothetical protein